MCVINISAASSILKTLLYKCAKLLLLLLLLLLFIIIIIIIKPLL